MVATRDGLARGLPQYRGLSIMTVGGADGLDYLYGDAINLPALESDKSVAAIIQGYLRERGLPALDIGRIAGRVASSVGGAEFGNPELPDGIVGVPLPGAFIVVWKPIVGTFRAAVPDAQDWPVVFGLAVVVLLRSIDNDEHAHAMARLALESTVAMSKTGRRPEVTA